MKVIVYAPQTGIYGVIFVDLYRRVKPWKGIQTMTEDPK